MKLSKRETHSFDHNGFLAITPLFDETRINEINKEIDRFIQNIVPTMPVERVYFEDNNDRSTLKQVQKLFDFDPYFNELMCNSEIRGIAEQLLQDDVRPINMQYFNKPPRTGQATPPHQDGYYFHLNPCEAVTGWLALEPVDKENGCVHYVKHSHQCKQFRNHGPTGVLGFSQGITDFGTTEDVQNSVACPGNAGTFLIHHARTIHYAGPNLSSTRSRRALGFIYYAARAHEDVKAKEEYQRKLDAELRAKGKI